MQNSKGHHFLSAMQKAAACNKPAAFGSGDRLSKLPNDVLLNILERLDTLDAVRTCILNKQMLKLPTMLSQFVINIDAVARYHDKSCQFGLRDFIGMNHTVADVTDNILSARNPEITIRKLNVRFVLKHDDFLSICRSFARTMSTHKVRAAEFEILTEQRHKGFPPPDDLLHFAEHFNTFLGAFPDVFSGLTCLRLENMRFAELDIPNLLSTCKRLESLRFSFCNWGMSSMVQLEHAQLAELEIFYGRYGTFELTCLPKLQRLRCNILCSYEDHPLSFGFVPQLSHLRLAKTALRRHKVLELSKLFANVPSISDMHLDFQCERIWVQPECPKVPASVLGKLRHVTLDNLPEGCDIAWTMFILEAAPFLEELCITVWDHLCLMNTDKEFRKLHGFWEKTDLEWEPSSPDMKHENLAKLTIYGFQPNEKFVRYVRRVMVAAVNMEEISLHDRKECKDCKNKMKVNMEEKSLHDRKLCKLCKRCKDMIKLNTEDDRKFCKRCIDKIKVCPPRYPRTIWEEYFWREEIRKGLAMASPAVVRFRS